MNIIVSEKPWHKDMHTILNNRTNSRWVLINQKCDLTVSALKIINPEYIFFPHWSYIIPKEIYNNFKCVMFHMTDLPFGRGGSPLQNLITRGFERTFITAFKCNNIVDGGDIYIKVLLDLRGTAEEIFKRAIPKIIDMIIKIVIEDIQPYPQIGTVTTFERRKSKDSEIKNIFSTIQLYDHIRMLDCPSYPRAFLKRDGIRYEFFDAKVINGKLKTQVEIIFE